MHIRLTTPLLVTDVKAKQGLHTMMGGTERVGVGSLGHHHLGSLFDRTPAMQGMLVKRAVRVDTVEHECVPFPRLVLQEHQEDLC